MQTNFAKRTYTTVFQDVGPITAVLVAGAAAAPIAIFDVTPLARVSVSVKVSVAALTGLEVWVRTDRVGGEWMQLTLDQLGKYGRSDSGTDPTTTPVAVTCFVTLDCADWCDVQIRAKSAGAASLDITAGGK